MTTGDFPLTEVLCVTQAWSGLETAPFLKQRIAFNYQCQKRGKPFIPVLVIVKNKRGYEEKEKCVDHFSIFSIAHKASLYNLSMSVILPSPKPTPKF